MNNRILYSCCASGGQHKIQFTVIANLLRDQGYEVMLLDSLPSFVTPCKDNVLLLDGCKFQYFDEHSRLTLMSIIQEFNPDLILNDLEPLVPMIDRAMGRKTPIISIDSMHMIDYINCDEIDEVVGATMDEAWSVFTRLVNSITPDAKFRVIPSFFPPDWTKNYGPVQAYFFGPIIRPEILDQIPSVMGNTVLVYNTNGSFSYLPDILHLAYPKFNFQFFGFDQPHKPNFAETLACCKFVITNGGHGVISEALYLRKPVFCIPIENHYEQFLNAYKVSALSLGISSTKETLIEDLDNFITNYPAMKAYVEDYNLTPGNDKILHFLMSHPLLSRDADSKKPSKQTPDTKQRKVNRK